MNINMKMNINTNSNPQKYNTSHMSFHLRFMLNVLTRLDIYFQKKKKAYVNDLYQNISRK